MAGKIGIFLAGMLVAFFLDPTSGGNRRAQANKRLAPLRQRLMAMRNGAPEDDAQASATPPFPDLLHSAAAVARRVQDEVGDASEMVTSMQATVEQTAQQVRDTLATASSTAPYSGTGGQPAAQAAETPAVTPQALAPAGPADPIPEGDPDEKHPGETINDPTLVARIESELYRNEAIPKGRLIFDAVHGVVTVRGTVSADIAGEVLERTRAVEGVREVVDRLQRE
ncbi:MAG TPA: BON domain-containing protein [Chloroflexota bacterium]|jgi:hypothetical protein|nr:BON domain-containing protein [Chloroflexota bacterium]